MEGLGCISELDGVWEWYAKGAILQMNRAGKGQQTLSLQFIGNLEKRAI